MKKSIKTIGAFVIGAFTLFGISISSSMNAIENAYQTFAASTSGLTFGTSNVKIDKASVSATDDAETSWAIVTAGTTSFTANAGYYQVGASKSPASSITFTGTVSKTLKLSSFSIKFGGFSGTAGSVTVAVGSTASYATGSLNAANDVTISGNSTVTLSANDTIVVSVTGIAKGVKVYNLEYSYTEEGSAASLTSVSITEKENFIKVNDTKALSYTYVADEGYSGATSVAWSSSDSTVATVSSEGVVTAVAPGSATITATSTVSSSISNSVNVLVLEHAGTSSSDPFSAAEAVSVAKYVGNEGTSANYYVSGLVTSASYSEQYNNGDYKLDDVFTLFRIKTNETVFTQGSDISVTNKLVVSGKILNHNNTTPEIGSDCDVVSIAKVSSIAVKTVPTKTAYQEGEKFDATGLTITATYSDNSTTEPTDFTYDLTGSLKTTDTIVTISYGGVSTTQSITVSERTLSSIAVTTNPTKTKYYTSDTELDATGIVVTGTYSNESTGDVTSDCTYSEPDFSIIGKQNITVTHTPSGKTTTFEIEVVTLEEGIIADGQYFISAKNSSSTAMMLPASELGYSVAPSAIEYSNSDVSKAWTFTHIPHSTYTNVYTIKCGEISLYSTDANNGVRAAQKADSDCGWRIVKDGSNFVLYPVHANANRKLALYEGTNNDTAFYDWRTYTSTSGIQSINLVSANASSDTSSTASTTIEDIATANNWETGKQYFSFSINSIVTVSTLEDGTTNNGKYYYSSNTGVHDWRLYQSEGGYIKIDVTTGYELESVTIVYEGKNGGELENCTSDTAYAATGNSLSINVITGGSVKITSISVAYKESSGGTTPDPEPDTSFTVSVASELDLDSITSFEYLNYPSSAEGQLYAYLAVSSTRDSDKIDENIAEISGSDIYVYAKTGTYTVYLQASYVDLTTYETVYATPIEITINYGLKNFVSDFGEVRSDCNNGVNPNASGIAEDWVILEDYWEDLSSSEQNKFTSTVSNSAANTDTLENTAALYDLVVAKYSLNNFANRSVSSNSPAIKSLASDSSTITSIVTIAAVTSITLVGGLTLSRKRKEF